MNAHPIERHFARIGARARLSAGAHRRLADQWRFD